MLSGVFIVFPLDPEHGDNLQTLYASKCGHFKLLTCHLLDGTEGLGQPSVGLRPTRASLEILIVNWGSMLADFGHLCDRELMCQVLVLAFCLNKCQLGLGKLQFKLPVHKRYHNHV